MYYAELNEANMCTSVIQTAGPMVGPRFIPLEFFDISVLGKTWNGTGWD